MLPVPFLVIRDVIDLKIINFCVSQLPDFIRQLSIFYKYFSLYIYFEGNLDSANNFNNMTSDYVDVSIKLFSEVGNDEYIVLCNFGGLSISGLISYQS